MHPLGVVLIYLAAVFGGGALLAPWVYTLAQWGAGHWPALAGLAEEPFARYLNRCWLLLALVGLWPFLRALGARSLAEIGLVRSPAGGRQLRTGFVIGLCSLALVMGAAVLAGARLLDLTHSGRSWFRFAGQTALAATVVALLEELVFRAGVFGGLRRAFSWRTAAVASSILFATLHFLRSPAMGDPSAIGWTSGFAVLGRMLAALPESGLLGAAGLSLFLVGLTLALAYQQTEALWFSIGLHAGWIVCQKAYGFLTDATRPPAGWFWGSNRLIDGWLAVGVLGAIFVFLAALEGRAKRLRAKG